MKLDSQGVQIDYSAKNRYNYTLVFWKSNQIDFTVYVKYLKITVFWMCMYIFCENDHDYKIKD